MSAALAIPGNTADTFLVHFFGTGLADDRYVVERYRARADGDIVPAPREGPWQGEAHGRLAQAGRGDASRLHGDHHLHGAQHPRRLPGVGLHRRRYSLRPQAEGLTAPFQDVQPAFQQPQPAPGAGRQHRAGGGTSAFFLSPHE